MEQVLDDVSESEIILAQGQRGGFRRVVAAGVVLVAVATIAVAAGIVGSRASQPFGARTAASSMLTAGTEEVCETAQCSREPDVLCEGDNFDEWQCNDGAPFAGKPGVNMLRSNACPSGPCPPQMSFVTRQATNCEAAVRCCGKCRTCDSDIVKTWWKSLGGDFDGYEFLGCNSYQYVFKANGYRLPNPINGKSERIGTSGNSVGCEQRRLSCKDNQLYINMYNTCDALPADLQDSDLNALSCPLGEKGSEEIEEPKKRDDSAYVVDGLDYSCLNDVSKKQWYNTIKNSYVKPYEDKGRDVPQAVWISLKQTLKMSMQYEPKCQ